MTVRRDGTFRINVINNFRTCYIAQHALMEFSSHYFTIHFHVSYSQSTYEIRFTYFQNNLLRKQTLFSFQITCKPLYVIFRANFVQQFRGFSVFN